MSEESDMTKSNPNLVRLIEALKRASRESGAPIWRDIADGLERPSSRWAEVNIGELERVAEAGETVAIPGKLLGGGNITKAVTVASYRCSREAKRKLEGVGGRAISLLDLLGANPSGSEVRLMR